MLRLTLLVASFGLFSGLEVYVSSSTGDDTNSGLTPAQAFRSLAHAQSAVRKRNPAEGATVHLLDGSFFNGTDVPLYLSAADSGTAAAPVVWQGEGNVVISGGVSIPHSAFQPCGGRSGTPPQTLCADLTKFGITDFGKMVHGGLKDCQHDKAELIFDHEVMTLARWPNILPNGTWQWANVATVVDNITFTVNSTEPLEWASEADPWLHGYWSQDWADSYVHVHSFSAKASATQIAIDPATPPPAVQELFRARNVNLHASARDNIRPLSRFYGVNILAELDVPGEYYISHDGTLYFYPPSPLPWPGVTVQISVAPSVIFSNSTSYLTLKGLHIEGARGSGIVAVAAEGLAILNCTIRSHGVDAVHIDGHDVLVQGNTVSNVGCIGIAVTGGDQLSLQPGNNRVIGNTVSDFSRWKRTYKAGIFWGGVRNTYSSNSVSNGPHNAFLGGGNEATGVECLFEYNTIKHIAYETSDTGAFYTCGQSGQAWINPRHILRHNTFVDIRNHQKPLSVQAIYLDDQMSYWTVENNTFTDCQVAMFIGGGRSNRVFNNTFKQCDTNVHLDDRGLNWQKTSCQAGGDLQQGLQSVHYQQPPWSTQFPELQNITQDHVCVPVYNAIVRNRYCGGTFIDISADQAKQWLVTLADNVQSC